MSGDNNYCGTVIYLVCWPITQREVDSWGFEYLKSEGFDVQVYDLTYLLRKQAILKSPVASKIINDYIHEIRSYKELSARLNDLSANTIFIDYVVSILDISLQTSRLFRMLRKADIRYCIVYSGTVPGEVNTNNTLNGFQRLAKRIKKALNPQLLFEYIFGRINRILVRYTDIYPFPEKLFTTIGSDVVNYYTNKYPQMKNRLVAVNAHDYDNYVEYIKMNPNIRGDNTCVFLDEAATHHSDYVIMGLKPLEKEGYFRSLNRLFGTIESRTGLRVVIAAHPKSRYKEMPGAFGEREIIKGKTMELISRSSMVVMHFSTSVSFAVLFRKPILVVKTQGMITEGWYAEGVDAIAESLGLVAHNIDNMDLSLLDLNYSKWSQDKYSDYKRKYLTSDASAGHTTWEIVSYELKKMLSNERY